MLSPILSLSGLWLLTLPPHKVGKRKHRTEEHATIEHRDELARLSQVVGYTVNASAQVSRGEELVLPPFTLNCQDVGPGR